MESKIRIRKSGKLLSLEDFAIKYCNANPTCGFVYCDIECLTLAMDGDTAGFWYLLDECGSYIWIDPEVYEVVRGDKSD